MLSRWQGWREFSSSWTCHQRANTWLLCDRRHPGLSMESWRLRGPPWWEKMVLSCYVTCGVASEQKRRFENLPFCIYSWYYAKFILQFNIPQYIFRSTDCSIDYRSRMLEEELHVHCNCSIKICLIAGILCLHRVLRHCLYNFVPVNTVNLCVVLLSAAVCCFCKWIRFKLIHVICEVHVMYM